uniref:Protein ROOT HAIR DEFECTIVE 3 homolog 2 isoform X3 n=1 Tax=Rhizophora mucronata TaxID=61149 RepID=A0A2P2L855_RHIMU
MNFCGDKRKTKPSYTFLKCRNNYPGH